MPKIGIIYWSGAGNTEKMAALIEKGAREAGAETICKRVDETAREELAEYDVIVFGSPAMGAEVLEESEMAPFIAAALPELKDRKVALFGSYGWGDGEWMRNWAAAMRTAGVKLMDDGLIVNEAPEDEKEGACLEYGRKLAAF